MIKFVPISKVHNYVSSVVKQTVAPDQIDSWALQAYNRVQQLGATEFVVTPIEIVNYKALLPKDVIRIYDVIYSEGDVDTISPLIPQEVMADNLLLYQKVFFSELGSKYRSMRLYYRGQNRGALITSELYCRDCAVGFSLNSDMTCMTIDIANGCVWLIYERKVKEGEVFMVPDSSTLHEGLAAFVEARFWRDRMYSHEQNANNFYQEALNRAELLLHRYEGEVVASKVDPEAQNQFVFSRNKFDLK